MIIRTVAEHDIAAITNIYNHYIKHTTITFEEDEVSQEMMAERIHKLVALGLPWLVVEEQGIIKGYAYAGQWHARTAYRFTVEPTIYLANEATGHGIGRSLYLALLERLKPLGIKHIIGVIALPNPASVGLHESMGFRKVGEFENIGFKFNQSISVGYWQLTLNE